VKTIRRTLKILMVLAFVWNTGIVSSMFYRISSEEEYNPKNIPVMSKLLAQMSDEARQKVKAGGIFSPEDYFSALSRMYFLEDSLHVPLGVISMGGCMNEMYFLMKESIDKGYFTHNDIALARKKLALRDEWVRKKFFEDTKHVDYAMVLKDVLQWLWSLYLKNFLPAFLLLVVWFFERGQGRTFRSPLSFGLCVLFYPVFLNVVFIRWCKIKGREFYARADLQRTKERFFHLLSEDEVLAIKLFAQSKIKLAEWKTIVPHARYRRSFAVAILSLLLCAVCTKIGFSLPVDSPQKTEVHCMITCDESNPATDEDVGGTTTAVPAEINYYPVHFIVIEVLKATEERMRKGARKEIMHVPLLGLVSVISKFLQKTKQEIYNEIFRMDFCGIIFIPAQGCGTG
jgi:hypothetical protein